MTAQPLPPRPDLDQLKRRAKELLKRWRVDPSTWSASTPPRLRDAQRAIAAEHGFSSWDALRTHVRHIVDPEAAEETVRKRRGMDYDDPIRDVIVLRGALTRDTARQLAEQHVSGVKVDATVAPESLEHLAHVTTLRRIDFSNRDDIRDDHVRFLQALTDLTAVSFSWCPQLTDAAVGHLRTHQRLEQVNLKWTRTGDDAVAFLSGKPHLCRVVLGNRLTDKGTAHLRDFPALAVATGADSFLSISGGRALTDAALADVGTLKGVAALDVHTSAFGSPYYTNRGVAHLRGMTSLEQLNFHGQLATDAVLQEIAGISGLRHLHSQDAISGDEGFVALGKCTTLAVLTCRTCHRITNRGFAAIAGLPRLRSLGLGGSRLTDDAMAFLADSPMLEDLGPILFGDDAFAHIAKIPKLQRLTNMYNRATTDAATRHLRDHPTLVHYSAFGTQITDESLRILSSLPNLETLEFENCAGITDQGLRELMRLPRLRRVSAWSCINVKGTWTGSAPTAIEAKSEGAPPEQSAGYRAETLMDYPDMPVGGSEQDTPHVRRPGLSGRPGVDAIDVPVVTGAAPALVSFGLRCDVANDALQLSVEPGVDTRWIGVLTREAFAVPVRIALSVKPIDELRLVFGAHNRVLAFDEDGNVQDPAPWFMRTESQQGQSHSVEETQRVRPGEWVQIVVEIDEAEKRLFVNERLRHTWRDDYAGLRSRLGIGLKKTTLGVRELTITRS